MIEFTLLMPIFFFLLLLGVDLGRLTFYQGTIQDATYAAARAGAQVGNAGSASSGPAKTAFTRQINAIPGLDTSTGTITINGSPVCTTGSQYIEITGQATYRFVTPGLAGLFDLAFKANNGSSILPSQTGLAMVSRAAVLCEVVRG